MHERAVLEGLASPADGDGAQEQALEAGREGGIALVDGVLGVESRPPSRVNHIYRRGRASAAK